MRPDNIWTVREDTWRGFGLRCGYRTLKGP